MDTDLSRRATPTRTDPTALRLMHGYQQWAYLPAPRLLPRCCFRCWPSADEASAADAAGAGARQPCRARAATDGVLVALLSLCCLVVPAATAVFDYRYGLPATCLAPIGAALAVIALRGQPTAVNGQHRTAGAGTPPEPQSTPPSTPELASK